MPDKTTKFDTALIRELAAILREGDLGEIEIEQDDLRIRVSRSDGSPVHVAAPVHYAPAPSGQPAAGAVASQAPTAAAAPAAEHPGTVTSPMVGTAYLTPDPESPPFIKVGDQVSEGQTLLLVEAMKTFNPVIAPKAGTVKSILVGNEQPVEFGEALVIVE